MKALPKLRDFGRHLDYEVRMLRRCANELDQKNQPPWLRCVCLEAFAIHIRNLLDFYYGDKGKSDDALAKHYFRTAEEWNAVRGSRPVTVKLIMDRANKQVAHLTYKRIGQSDSESRWAYRNFLNVVEQMNRAFAKHAPPGTLEDRHRRTIGHP